MKDDYAFYSSTTIFNYAGTAVALYRIYYIRNFMALFQQATYIWNEFLVFIFYTYAKLETLNLLQNNIFYNYSQVDSTIKYCNERLYTQDRFGVNRSCYSAYYYVPTEVKNDFKIFG